MATVRSFLDNYLGSEVTILLYLGALLLLFFVCIIEQKVKNHLGKYQLLLFMMLLPSLYNNYYLRDGKYYLFAYYFISVVYFILLSYIKINRDDIIFAINLFIVFSIVTSLVTWLSLVNPNFYISNIIPLFPKQNQLEIYRNFYYLDNRAGLCTHYSRNAFFMVLGVIGCIYHYFKDYKKRYFFIILFLLASLFIVGKRGHLLFLIVSFVISYFIYNRVSYKTFIKFIAISCVFLVFTFFIVKLNPDIGFVFQRFSDDTSDVSNGRYDMYGEIWKQFRGNGYFPLGWAEFASSTGYVHPGVHNDYIQIFCETGFIGFIMIVGSNIMILVDAIKHSRLLNNSSSLIILIYNLFFLTYSLTGLPHYDIETYMYYFLINYLLYFDLYSIRKVNNGKNCNSYTDGVF